MNPRLQILKSLSEITNVDLDQINLEFPENEEHGHYSSNLALKIKKPAHDLRSKLLEDSNLMQLLEKIEVAGPGFLNFYLKQELLEKNLEEIIKKDQDYGKHGSNGKRIMLEFGQPNTHKLAHIGHLYSYILGESLSRILEASGYEVYRVNYQGDIGLHVAKCLWAFQKGKPGIPNDLEEKVKLLQKMYQQGSKAYEEDEEAKQEIIDLNKDLYANSESIKQLWQETRDWNILYYKEFERNLGISFDKYYFESEVYKNAIDIVSKNKNKVFKESQGALIFEGSKYGLHDRVFITQFGTPTYEAKDLALEKQKMNDWPFDLLIITTANEQNEYFKVIFKALETLDKDFVGKLKHIGFGMVNLKSGKMSSRTGNILSAIDLVDKTVEAVSELSENKDIARMVGIGAVKYSFLKNNPLQNMTFDFDESISLEGNSGPYIQYTYARAKSVLEKAKNIESFDNSCENTLYPEEQRLMRLLSQFPDTILICTKMYSPNLLAEYLHKVAQCFNSFYNNHKIIGSQKEEYRIKLTQACSIVIKNGLNLLGIEALSKM